MILQEKIEQLIKYLNAVKTEVTIECVKEVNKNNSKEIKTINANAMKARDSK